MEEMIDQVHDLSIKIDELIESLKLAPANEVMEDTLKQIIKMQGERKDLMKQIKNESLKINS